MNAYADSPGRTSLRSMVIGCLAFAGVATAAIWTAAEQDARRAEFAAAHASATAPAGDPGGTTAAPATGQGAADPATGAPAEQGTPPACKDGALLSRSRKALFDTTCWPNP